MGCSCAKLGKPFKLLDAAVADGPGDSMPARGLDGFRVTATGSGGANADVVVEVSVDETNWQTFGVPLTFAADGTQTIFFDEPVSYIRLSVDNYVAGSFDGYVQRFV